MASRKNDPNRISNIPLREPFLNCGKTPSQIARELGKVARTTGGMDTTGLQRMLGLRESPGGWRKGRRNPSELTWYAPSTTSTIRIDVARTLCQILGEDFDVLYEDLMPVQKPAAHCKTCGEPMLRRVPSGQCGFCVLELEEFGRVAVAA